MKSRPITSEADLVRQFGAKFIIEQAKIILTGKETIKRLREIALTLCNDCISMNLTLDNVLGELKKDDRKKIDVKLGASTIKNLSLTEAINLVDKKEELVAFINAMQAVMK